MGKRGKAALRERHQDKSNHLHYVIQEQMLHSTPNATTLNVIN